MAVPEAEAIEKEKRHWGQGFGVDIKVALIPCPHCNYPIKTFIEPLVQPICLNCGRTGHLTLDDLKKIIESGEYASMGASGD